MRAIDLPFETERALAGGATLAASISGGKDSQALLNALIAVHRERHWPGKIFAIHADLGRAEWKQPLPAHRPQLPRQHGRQPSSVPEHDDPRDVHHAPWAPRSPKSESFIVLEGELAFFTFDDAG